MGLFRDFGLSSNQISGLLCYFIISPSGIRCMAVTVSLRVARVLYSRSDPEGPCSGGTASTDVAERRAVVNQSDRQLLGREPTFATGSSRPRADVRGEGQRLVLCKASSVGHGWPAVTPAAMSASLCRANSSDHTLASDAHLHTCGA